MTPASEQTDLPENVRNYLGTHHALTLATVSPEGVPHATTLTYANDGRVFYVWMRRDTVTANHLLAKPTVAFTVDVYAPDWRRTKGVQASGQASEIVDPAQRDRAVQAFEDRFPGLITDGADDLVFFRIVASEVHYIDSEVGASTDASPRLGADFHRDLVFSVFSDLPREQVDEVAAQLEAESISAGDVIVQQGEAADSFFIVVDGEVEVVRDEKVVATLGRGEFFGEIAVLRDQPRTATVRATGPASVLRMDRSTFRGLIAQSLGTTARIDEIIQERLAMTADG